MWIHTVGREGNRWIGSRLADYIYRNLIFEIYVLFLSHWNRTRLAVVSARNHFQLNWKTNWNWIYWKTASRKIENLLAPASSVRFACRNIIVFFLFVFHSFSTPPLAPINKCCKLDTEALQNWNFRSPVRRLVAYRQWFVIITNVSYEQCVIFVCIIE